MTDRDRESPDEKASGRSPEQTVTGGDGTRYTVAELRERVRMVEPGIIVLCQIPVGAREPLVVMTGRVRELAPTAAPWALIIDLVESKGALPGPYRRFVTQHLPTLGAAYMGMALYSNPVVRGVSRFVARRIGLNVTVHRDIESAVTAMRAALADHTG
jgi:hypothetical protein